MALLVHREQRTGAEQAPQRILTPVKDRRLGGIDRLYEVGMGHDHGRADHRQVHGVGIAIASLEPADKPALEARRRQAYEETIDELRRLWAVR